MASPWNQHYIGTLSFPMEADSVVDPAHLQSGQWLSMPAKDRHNVCRLGNGRDNCHRWPCSQHADVVVTVQTIFKCFTTRKLKDGHIGEEQIARALHDEHNSNGPAF